MKVRWTRARQPRRRNPLLPGLRQVLPGTWHALSHTKEGYTRCGKDVAGFPDPQYRSSVPEAADGVCSTCVTNVLRGVDLAPDAEYRGSRPQLVIHDEAAGFPR